MTAEVTNQPVPAPSPSPPAIWWMEANNVTLTAAGGTSPTITGGNRLTNSLSGGGSYYSYFQVSLQSQVAGNLSIYNNSLTGNSGVASVSVSANQPLVVKVPALGGAFTAVFTNQSTSGGTASMTSGFTN